MRCISPKINRNAGFTLVEVMVIAPFIILAITGIIALIIVLTGDVLRVKGTNDLVYNTQNALSQIEQDVNGATEFRQTSYAPTSPQGQADNAVAFDTISQATTHLILRSNATSKSPDSQERRLIFKQSGGTCSTSPYTFDIVYFTKVTSGITSLWRRVIFGNTTDAGTPCTGTTPWQAPSCTPGYTSTVCSSEDSLLLENVSAMTVQYLNAAGTQINTTTPNAGSAARNPNDAAGTTNASSAEVSLTTLNTVAGRDSTYTGTILSSKPSKIALGGGGGPGGSITFDYTGAAQTWQVPAGKTSIQIEAWGAEGGEGRASSSPILGGLGGYAKGNLTVTPGETLYIYVGGKGGNGHQGTVSGGFNGGGSGYVTNSSYNGSGGGGGADVRKGGQAMSNRQIVAGGGGGGADGGSSYPNQRLGGGGGGASGGSTVNAGSMGPASSGGTQSSGGGGGAWSGYSVGQSGSLGLGGSATTTNSSGGGGGGYYGGGGGTWISGGGGSSYIGGVASGTTTTGIRSGNGQVVITY